MRYKNLQLIHYGIESINRKIIKQIDEDKLLIHYGIESGVYDILKEKFQLPC